MGCAKPIDAAIDELIQQARAISVDIQPTQASQFRHYIETLLLWRARISLTTAATPVAVVRDHIVDSLHICCEARRGARIADLGSGAGFPGLPIAIINPASAVTLVESRRKRANFLREVIRHASLTNVRVAEQRAESLQQIEAGLYDIVTSRALTAVAKFLEVSAPLLKDGGLAIAMKGPKGIQEAEYRAVGFASPRIADYRLGGGQTRLLLIYRKI